MTASIVFKPRRTRFVQACLALAMGVGLLAFWLSTSLLGGVYLNLLPVLIVPLLCFVGVLYWVPQRRRIEITPDEVRGPDQWFGTRAIKRAELDLVRSRHRNLWSWLIGDRLLYSAAGPAIAVSDIWFSSDDFREILELLDSGERGDGAAADGVPAASA